MNTEIASVRENPLLGRRDVELDINHDGEPTPSEEDVKNRFAAENDLEVEKIEVESIKTGYGSNTSRGLLKVHEEFEYKEELEERPEERQAEEIEEKVEDGETEEVEEEEPEERESEDESDKDEADYEEIVSGTISEAKDELGEMEDPDYSAALEAEKDNKNRTTFIDWLESRED